MPDLRVVGEGHHLLDELLAAVVGRVALAGDDQLHRPLGVQQQRLEPLRVAQHQGQPLVRGHPAGEADGEDVGVEGGLGPAELGLGGPAGQRGLADAAAHLLDQPAAQRAADAQRSAAGILSTPSKCTAPSTSTGSPWLEVWVPISTSSRAVQVGACTPLVIEPIGTSLSSKPGHRSLNMPRLTCPCSSADAVGPLPQPQAHVRHVELGGVLLGTEREQLVQRDPEAGEVALDERLREAVDARRHRRVRGEHGARADGLQRLGEAQPCASVSSRIRSTPWKPAWPSLAWKTSGCGVPVSPHQARSARTPPMPSSISWRRRWSSSPP